MTTASLRTPGPKSLDTFAPTGARVDLGNRMNRRDLLIELFQDTHARTKVATAVANGEWHSVWPDLTVTPEAPTVANIVEVGIAHWASLFGSVIPSLRAPINASADRSQAKRGARKRERRVKQLWKHSNINELGALWGGDYAGAGFAVGMAWANFGEPNPAKRDPYLMRIDPRHAFFRKDNVGNITELLVARKISYQDLIQMFKETDPAYLSVFDPKMEDEIEEWFWIDKDRFYHAIVDTSKKGRKENRHVVLLDVENELGFVPAEEAMRPTFDGQRRGVFDQTVHILRTMHRLMVMTIHSTEEHSYPATLSFDIANAEDFGPGANIEMLSPDAQFDRLAPSNHFDVKDLIQRLGDEGRTQGALPQQLFGEPGASIVSARGINAAMGALDARLAVAHKQFERFYGKLSSHLLAIDEKYCAGDKTIAGDTENDKAEPYNPERDVNGNYTIECTYGLGAGSDPANTEMRLHMHLGGELISKQTARHELPFLDDPDGEPLKIFREQMIMAVSQGILARASELGDPSFAAKALELLESDDVDFEEVIEKLVDFIGQPQPQPGAPGAPGGAAGAALGAESLARGGIPGNAEQAPAPGPPLPPLGQLLGGGPNQVA